MTMFIEGIRNQKCNKPKDAHMDRLVGKWSKRCLDVVVVCFFFFLIKSHGK